MASNGKFVAYYRVSTKAQGASGLGLDAQREAVARYLNGGDWTLVGEYQDVESGTRKGNNRPELMKAIAHAKREKATLVIAKLDRLARNVAFVSNLMESGVDFVAVDNPQANKLTIHVLAAVAEAEADAISKRTKEALAAAKGRGTKLGNPKNLSKGGKVRGTSATEKQAYNFYLPLVPRIRAAREKGDSYGAIAAQLNEEGEVTREGRPFKAMTVKRVFDRFNEKEEKPMPTPRKRRHPLMEPIPKELISLLKVAEPDVTRLRDYAAAETGREEAVAAALHFIDRFEGLAADPDRWMPNYIDRSIDKIVAMSRLLEGSPRSLLDDDQRLPMARRLRRQAYWAWMRNDLARLDQRRGVHEPFMCDVPPRHVGQKELFQASAQDAAEFYQLAAFLPAYYSSTGTALSYVRKGDPGKREPDFIVEDLSTGEEIGLEMTDSISGLRAARNRFFWQLVADLEEALDDFEGSIAINDRQYDYDNDIRWEVIARRYREAFLSQVLERVKSASRGRFSVNLDQEKGLCDILVSFQRRRGSRFIVQMDQYGWSGDTPERLATKNLVEALSNKVDKTDLYTTQRTFLVVYPPSEPGVMEYDRVVSHAQAAVASVLARNNRFSEVWLNKDNKLWALHNAPHIIMDADAAS